MRVTSTGDCDYFRYPITMLNIRQRIAAKVPLEPYETHKQAISDKGEALRASIMFDSDVDEIYKSAPANPTLERIPSVELLAQMQKDPERSTQTLTEHLASSVRALRIFDSPCLPPSAKTTHVILEATYRDLGHQVAELRHNTDGNDVERYDSLLSLFIASYQHESSLPTKDQETESAREDTIKRFIFATVFLPRDAGLPRWKQLCHALTDGKASAGLSLERLEGLMSSINWYRYSDVRQESAALVHSFLAYQELSELLNTVYTIARHSLMHKVPFTALNNATSHLSQLPPLQRMGAMTMLEIAAAFFDEPDRIAIKTRLECERDTACARMHTIANIVTHDLVEEPAAGPSA